MQHRPVLSTGFALFLMTAGSIRAEAQLCAPDWIGFPVSGPRGPVFALQEHDDGSGNALFLGGSNLTNGGAVPTYVGVMRWRGAALEPLYPGTTNAMTSFDFGAGPELFAAGAYPTVPIVPQTIDQVLRWNGATFTPLGSSSPSTTSFQPNSVYALAAHDDGGGSALYAGGNCVFRTPAACSTPVARAKSACRHPRCVSSWRSQSGKSLARCSPCASGMPPTLCHSSGSCGAGNICA